MVVAGSFTNSNGVFEMIVSLSPLSDVMSPRQHMHLVMIINMIGVLVR